MSAPAPGPAFGAFERRGGISLVELLRLAGRNLRGYPLRTLLTTLGIVFGVASVIVMLALGEGAQREILAQIGQMGIRNVIVNTVKPPETPDQAGRRRWISQYGLTFRDFEQIRDTLPGVTSVLPVHTKSERAWYGSSKVDVTLVGVTPAHFERASLRVARGRAVTEADEGNLATVCVVRAGLLRRIGWFGEPLDYPLQVGEKVYKVVGLLEDEEFRGHYRKALETEFAAEEIYVPYRTMLAREGTLSFKRSTGSFESTNIELNQILVEASSVEQVLPTARMVTAILQKFHAQQDWQVVVPLELLAQRQKTQNVFNIALVLIASISLLVGGIGIANIMLATVTERTREIGVRRALGAKRRHVLLQFLTETVAISASGGILGIALGVGGAVALQAFTGWSTAVTPWSIGAAFLISCGVGVASGIFPARRAALLDPIEALRYQ
ncbi:MAG: ABC transporter permease [Planctomycetaceae bacterium]|nr:ABC transporter permease [Planctomycetota bacterium]NUN52715.1 ABC transporter permease [Planctomycetaceae bacterium]